MIPWRHLPLPPDVAKAGRKEETLRPQCVCQRESEGERFALIGDTRSPPATSAAVNTVGTKRRDQRPTRV